MRLLYCRAINYYMALGPCVTFIIALWVKQCQKWWMLAFFSQGLSPCYKHNFHYNKQITTCMDIRAMQRFKAAFSHGHINWPASYISIHADCYKPPCGSRYLYKQYIIASPNKWNNTMHFGNWNVMIFFKIYFHKYALKTYTHTHMRTH